MWVTLKKLNFRNFITKRYELFNLLDENRARLSPWFWWADEKVTPTRFRFYVFMTIYLTDTKCRNIAHKLNPKNLYDEQFIVYNPTGQIGGMCGLDDIDTEKNKTAEIWGLAFKGNNETIESVKILEKYCVDILNLKSIYGKVQSTNRASKFFWEKYGYDSKTLEKNVRISEYNPNVADIYTYVKNLSR